MRSLWVAPVAVTIVSAGGCGTMVNVTDIDDHGREAYGGVARDFRFIGQLPGPQFGFPRLSPGTSAKGAVAALVLYPALLLAYPGCLATEVSLSAVGDACTLPLLPVLDRFDDVIRPGRVLPEGGPSRQTDWLHETDWLLGLRAPQWATDKAEPPIPSSAGEPPQAESGEAEDLSHDDLPPLPGFAPSTPPP